MAVARYVQEAPLIYGIEARPSNLSIEDAISILKWGGNKNTDEQRELLQSATQADGHVTTDDVDKVMEHITITEAPTDARQLVLNAESDVTHMIARGPNDGLEAKFFSTRCGWHFGLSSKYTLTEKTTARRCRRCFSAADSSDSDDSD
jgi:hypothetical protein